MYRSGSNAKKGEKLLPRTVFVKMTFLTDVVKMGHFEEELFAVLYESERDRKRRQILAKVTETVAAYRLREMKDLQTLEQLATWRRMNGFDRVADGDDNWFHGPRSLPPTPQEFTESSWTEVNALKDAISMPARTRPWQKTMRFVEGLKGDLLDNEFAAIKRYVERRGREAAQVTVTPVSTVRHCIPCSLNPEMPPDVLVWRVTRVRWTQSKTSSNYHRLVRVLKHPDSSVTRSGRQDEPPPTAS